MEYCFDSSFISKLISLVLNPIAAVSSLAKFGAHCEDLLPNITVLLQRSLLDVDDEVRDRATYYLNILNEKQKPIYSQYILNGKFDWCTNFTWFHE